MTAREMKDSGVEWIGGIPQSWKIIPNKYVMKKIKDIHPVYKGETILSLSQKGVIVRDLDNPSGKMPTTFDGYQYVRKGNLLMCLFDIDVTPRCIGLIQNDGLCSPAYSQFALNEKGYAPYYYYYYLNLDFTKELLHLAKNLRHSLNEEQLGNVPIPCPPADEQVAIANFLDTKCEEIDSLTAEIEKQIETLQEYKKSVITEAVTKGLDPNVEMKDSGVEWIGVIPKNWKVIKLSYLAHGLNGDRGSNYPSGSDLIDEGVPFVSTWDLTSMFVTSTKKKITEDRYKLLGGVKLRRNDLIFCLRGSVGKCSLCDFDEGTVASSLMVIRAKEEIAMFLFFALSSQYFGNQLLDKVNGSCAANLSAQNVMSTHIVLPPERELLEITQFVMNKCSSIDLAIQDKRLQLETLAQYKQSLIYEYVTGKKAVPM